MSRQSVGKTVDWPLELDVLSPIGLHCYSPTSSTLCRPPRPATYSWRCHDMEISSALLVLDWWIYKGPVISFLFLSDDSPNKLLKKQLICHWIDTPWHSCDAIAMINCFCCHTQCSIKHIDVFLWFVLCGYVNSSFIWMRFGYLYSSR